MKTKMSNKCTCTNPKLVFKKYWFKAGSTSYKGTCARCGLVRGWYDGKNYKIVACNSPKGGDTR